jgi:hypothetical protein
MRWMMAMDPKFLREVWKAGSDITLRITFKSPSSVCTLEKGSIQTQSGKKK